MKQVAGKKISTSTGHGGETTHADNRVADGAGFYPVQPVTELVEVSIGDVVDSGIDSSGPVDDFVYLDIGSVDRERKTFVEPKSIPLAKAPSRAKQKVQAGDVLVSMTRPNLNAVAQVTQEFHGSIASTGFHVLRSPWIETGFLYYLVQTENFIDAMCNVVQGALYPAVRPRDIEAFRFYLPPRAEQTRILEKLEELLSDLDAGVAELKAAQRKLAQYRQSLLKAAVEGALTSDWRTAQYNYDHPPRSSSPRKRGSIGSVHHGVMDSRFRGNDVQSETGADLLQRILTERRTHWETRQLARFAEQGKTPPKGWQAKYPEPAAPDTIGLSSLPKGWVWASAEQLCDFITKGTTPPKGMDSGRDKTIPFLRVTNLTDKGELDFTDRVFVSTTVHKSFLARSVVYPNDVLMNIVGPPLGQVSIVPTDYDEWNINQAIAIFRAIPGLLPRFIAACLLSATARMWFKARAKTTAGQTNLTLELCRDLPIPLPPLEEQAEIIAILDAALSAVKEQEAAIDRGLQQSAAQRKNILKAAFAGQLVPQDPNDEPASVLLERIRAERAQLPTARGVQRTGSNRAPATSSPNQSKRGLKSRLTA